jgi:hypothetical protein
VIDQAPGGGIGEGLMGEARDMMVAEMATQGLRPHSRPDLSSRERFFRQRREPVHTGFSEFAEL